MGQINLSSTSLKPCNASQGYVQCDKVLDLSDYRNLYLQTAKEYLDKMSVSLNQLSNDVSNKEALNNLHIASHSLKSQSQVMGFTNVANICLNVEKSSNDALEKTVQLDNETISEIRKEVGKLGEILKSPKGTFLSGEGAVQDDTGK